MAQVIVLAGPSGSGKSHLAQRSGLPILRLDDFYKDGDDPTLPCVDLGGGTTVVDWDHPDSWNCAESLVAIEQLCSTGSTVVPTYDISASRRIGKRELSLGGANLFIAEGIFAQHVIAGCRNRGLLAAALCVTQHPLLTAVRRLIRDLREHRKPPLVLIKRGWRLMRRQPAVVRDAVSLGARDVSPDEAFAIITALR